MMDYKQQIINKALAFYDDNGVLPHKISVSPFVWEQIDSEPFGQPENLKNIGYTLDGKTMRLQLRARRIGADEMSRYEISINGTLIVKDVLDA